MRNLGYYFFILIFIGEACQSPNQAGKSEQASKDSPSSQIDNLAQRYVDLNRFSGAILVAEGDVIIHQQLYGFANQENQELFSDQSAFKIGHLSEIVTAFVIQKMAEKNLLDLNAPITKYFPNLEANFTIKELLLHQSGLPNIQSLEEAHPDKPYNTLEFIQLAKIDKNKKNQPSDLGYNLLGLLIEQVNQSDYQMALDQYLGELTLKNTYFQKPNRKPIPGYLFHNYQGQGLEYQIAPVYDEKKAFSSRGIKSTAEDIFKILQAYHGDIKNQNDYLPNDGFSYALRKDEKTLIIVLSNHRHPVGDEIAQSIQAIYKGENHAWPLLREVVEVDPQLFKEYEGYYALSPEMNLEVIAQEDSLFVMMGPNRIPIYPQSENQFFMKEGDAALRFLRDAKGEVNQVTLLDGFITGRTIDKVKP